MFGRLIVISCVALAVPGCKSTPEDEAHRWQTQLASASKWSARYPNLKPVIEQRVSEARTEFEAARAEADKTAKLAGMKRANEHLGTLVAPLDRHDRSVRAIRRLAKDGVLKALPAGDVSRTVRKANKAVSEARQILRQASPADPDDAIRILENAAIRVRAAESNLRRLRERARKAKKSARRRS